MWSDMKEANLGCPNLGEHELGLGPLKSEDFKMLELFNTKQYLKNAYLKISDLKICTRS